jgi:ATP-binding cassette, subfamily C (CFTR/MRP), member 1
MYILSVSVLRDKRIGSNPYKGQIPSIMTPSIMFAAYAITQAILGGDQINVVQAFTSLGLLSILITPVAQLVMVPTNYISVLSCLDRIQEFLVKEKRLDRRLIKPYLSQNYNLNGISDPQPSENEPKPLIHMSGGTFGWNQKKQVLRDISLDIMPSTLTILVGPVASGKSTLLKSFVGETRQLAGEVEFFASPEIAYCDQDPWILNETIRANIVGSEPFSQNYYDEVINASQLREDIEVLPKGDLTIVGSQGGALSGGQKHRIVSCATDELPRF